MIYEELLESKDKGGNQDINDEGRLNISEDIPNNMPKN